MDQAADTVTRTRWNDESGRDLYKIGALKVSILGGPGLRQMSVGGLVVSWKAVDEGEGGVSLLFANLKASWDAILGRMEEA